MVDDHDVMIAGRTTAGEILCSPARCADFAYLISIGGPAEREVAGFRNVGSRLRLIFEDASSEADGGASREDVERLIHFARQIDFTKGRLLVHCQAGISRSSAAAVIALAVLGGPGRERDAVSHVRRVHPAARPNLRMIELADTILQTNGALLQACQAS
jgi:predicted protein tyrosine phosphatase